MSDVPAIEVYNQLRRRVEHEDVLITQRLSWLVAAQSFLFTAYAITLNGFNPAKTDPYLGQKLHAYRLIPIVAVFTSGLIYVSIVAGVFAMARVRKMSMRNANISELISLPPVQSGAMIRRFGLAAPLLVPPAFIAVWVYLAVQAASR